MKTKILICLLLLLNNILLSQIYPINYNFNTLNGWTVTNGAGLQSGSGFSYLTTNIGTTPYPNNSVIIMQSPTYSFTNCVGSLSVTFPLSGIIETNYDYMSFQTTTNGSTWTTLGTFTGNQNTTLTYPLSNNVIGFRFRLVTDISVNTYQTGPWWNLTTYVYYYDIDYFTINCTNALPIELLYFNGDKNSCGINILTWATASETNNDKFIIERSVNGIDFDKIGEVKGAGNSVVNLRYNFIDNEVNPSLNYYKLKQIDLDGTFSYSDLISIDNSCETSVKTIKIYNLLGQEVDESYSGAIFIYRSDNTIIKRFQHAN